MVNVIKKLNCVHLDLALLKKIERELPISSGGRMVTGVTGFSCPKAQLTKGKPILVILS